MARKIRILNLILITALVLSFAAIIPAQAAPPAYVIDHFDSSTETIDITWANPPGTPMSASGAVDDAAVLGGEREIVATVTGGVNAEHLVVTTNNGGNSVANAAGGSSLVYTVDFMYDGKDNAGTAGVDATNGLGVTNLNTVGGNTNSEFMIGLNSMDQVGSLAIFVYSSPTSCSIVTLNSVGKVYDQARKIVEVPFADFTTMCDGATTNASFNSVRAIILRVIASGGNAGLDINIHSFGLANPPFTDTGDLPDTSTGATYEYNIYVDPSGTAVGENGPRHIIAGPRFGAGVTAEGDQQPAVGADLDSDDGVTVNTYWVEGANGGNFDITVSNCTGTCYVTGFIDWDSNGAFYAPAPTNAYDTGERVFVDAPVVNGMTRVSFNIPTGTALSDSFYYVRLRILGSSSGGSASPWGDQFDGEVQDYLVSFNTTAVSLTRLDARANSGEGIWLIAAAMSLGAGLVGVSLLRRKLG